MTPDEINHLIDIKIATNFDKKIGDTPTDALQLVNKRYVDDKIGGTVYAGHLVAGGAGTFFPTGWTATNPSTGVYVVTHNLNTTSYAVSATGWIIVTFPTTVYITGETSTTFTLNAYANGGLNNSEVDFILLTV